MTAVMSRLSPNTRSPSRNLRRSTRSSRSNCVTSPTMRSSRPSRSTATRSARTAGTTSRTLPRSRTAGTRCCASSSAPTGGASGGRRSPKTPADPVESVAASPPPVSLADKRTNGYGPDPSLHHSILIRRLITPSGSKHTRTSSRVRRPIGRIGNPSRSHAPAPSF